jgi:hypothetical protein
LLKKNIKLFETGFSGSTRLTFKRGPIELIVRKTWQVIDELFNCLRLCDLIPANKFVNCISKIGEVETQTRNSKLKLETQTRNSKLKLETQTRNSNSKLKTQTRNSSLKLKLETQARNSSSRLKLETRSRNSNSKHKLKTKNRNSKRKVIMQTF